MIRVVRRDCFIALTSKLYLEMVESDKSPNLQKFHWGAFLVPGLFCLVYNRYVLVLVLAFNFAAAYFSFYCVLLIPMLIAGLMGRTWSWENGRWKSTEDFENGVHNWTVLGVVFTFIEVTFLFLSIFGAVGAAG